VSTPDEKEGHEKVQGDEQERHGEISEDKNSERSQELV